MDDAAVFEEEATVNGMVAKAVAVKVNAVERAVAEGEDVVKAANRAEVRLRGGA